MTICTASIRRYTSQQVLQITLETAGKPHPSASGFISPVFFMGGVRKAVTPPALLFQGFEHSRPPFARQIASGGLRKSQTGVIPMAKSATRARAAAPVQTTDTFSSDFDTALYSLRDSASFLNFTIDLLSGMAAGASVTFRAETLLQCFDTLEKSITKSADLLPDLAYA